MAVRRKKKGGAWKGFVAGMGLAGIFGLLLMWAVAGPSGNKIREAFRSRMSVMADRADQFVDAWNRRQMPGKKEPKTPAAPAPAVPARPSRRSPTATTVPAPASGSDRPVLAPVRPAAPSPTPAPAPAPVAAPPPPPDKDITPDDQKQLRQLMQQINQGH